MTTLLPSVLSCRELVELVTDFLEDRLPRQERVRAEQHLLLCSGCAAYLDQLRAQIKAAGSLADEEIDAGMRDRLLVAFRGWKKQRGGSG